MRYFVGFVFFLLALGTLRVVGCGETVQECRVDKDCDDQNECTDDYCRRRYEQPVACEHELVERSGNYWTWGIVECSLGGALGFCVKGVCEEDSCDDGDDCSEEVPNIRGECAWAGKQPDGTPCELGGVAGVCIESACEEDNPCEGVVCDDGDLCTTDKCDYVYVPGICIFPPVDCTADGNPTSWHNDCKRNVCVPETGECDYTLADDRSCCLEWRRCYDICLGPCGDCGCVAYGHCRDGECG